MPVVLTFQINGNEPRKDTSLSAVRTTRPPLGPG